MEQISTLIREKLKSGDVEIKDKKKETPEEKKERIKRLEQTSCDFFNGSKGSLNEADGYNCDVCKNRGGIMRLKETADSFYQVYTPCKCMKIRGMLQKLKRSGLSKSIKEYSFEKYETKEPWQENLKRLAIQFTKDDKNTWFYIGGQSGCGKTHLCTAITAHYLRLNKSAHYMLWRDEVTKIKSSITNAEAYEKMISELKTVEVLYIDDMFKMGKDQNGQVQRPTAADINIAFEIINYRYNNRDLVTIVSSERSIHDIMDIDEAVGGRIFERCSKGNYLFNIKKDVNKNFRRKEVTEF